MDAAGSNGPLVEELELPAEIVSRLQRVEQEVTILPLRTDDTGATYGEATIDLVKVLRREGLRAGYLDPPEGRRFEVKKSDPASAVAWICMAIASGVTYDVVKQTVLAALGRLGRQQVDLQYAEVSEDGVVAWRVRGSADGVAKAVAELRK